MTHYFTLRALSAELDAALRGSVITGIFTQTKDELLITFSTGDALCTSVHPSFNYCFLQQGLTRAKRNTVDLFRSANGAAVVGVDMIPYDRTLAAELAGERRLLFRLYGTAASNIVLVDKDGSVLDAFKNRDDLRATTLRPGRAFREALLAEPEEFTRAFHAADAATAAASLKKVLPFLGTLYASEILFRAAVPADASSSGPEMPLQLFTAAREVITAAGTPGPRVYDNGTFSVIPLRHLDGHPVTEYGSVSEAIRSVVHASARAGDFASAKRTILQQLAAEGERIGRALRAVEAELRETGRADAYERQGKLIMAHLSQLRKGLKHAELEDLFGGGELVEIPLDPSLTPVQNAEACFAKARRARSSRVEVERRQTALGQQERVRSLLVEECEATSTSEELEAFYQRNSRTLKKMKIADADRNEEILPFRVFTVSGGYEVWVGKSSSNNDLLTMKYARPHDVWFHARGASGSHTVLRVRSRSEKVPREALRDAAAIAAYYSKMRKGKTVPVAYCERKYVRKPKHAPPGTVTLEREEVMFVDPRLPEPDA